jgi:hypothetical protein
MFIGLFKIYNQKSLMLNPTRKYHNLTLSGRVYKIHKLDDYCKIKFVCDSVEFTIGENECRDFHLGDNILLKAKYTKSDVFIDQKRKPI